MSLLSFDDNYRFYHAYHSEKRNQMVHVVFVPMILWSAFILLRYLWPADVVLCCVYGISYLALDFAFGVASLPYLISLLLTARYTFSVVGPQNAWKVAIFANVVSWVAQIGSHKYFEGNRPALLDSLVQAFLMAPLFVYLEVLSSFGLFRDRVNGLQSEKTHLTSGKPEM